MDNAWNGFNTSLFAYGQTGAGKSYSMVGYGEDKGIIPLTCDELFKRIQRNEEAHTTFGVEVSMLEIYNEQINDLLNPKNRPKGGLKIRSNSALGVYVEGLSKHVVKNYQEIEKEMEEGTLARTVASTNMNATSSRAHTVFTVYFTKTKNDPELAQPAAMQAKISLVDLAGSERAESTGATGDRLKEGSAINQSLSALGNVISALAEKSKGKKDVFVPYRNSALTRLLQESLGGNSKTIMIAALSPADINYEETLSTLRYADRAKQIKNKAVKNEDPQDKLIRELREQIALLQAQLAGGAGAMAATEALRQKRGDDDVDNGTAAEQLESTMKLLEEAQMTDAEKDARTAQYLKDREQDLEDNGLSILEIGGAYGIHKDQPHFVNLHEDPSLSENLIYFLKEGTTRIGKKGADPPNDICLSGLNLLDHHAICVYDGNETTLEPMEGARIFINGESITAKVTLTQSCRIILGNNHVYRFKNPKGAETQQKLDAHGNVVPMDWEFALMEMAAAQGYMTQADVEARSKEMEERSAAAQKELEEKLKQMEEELQNAKADAAKSAEESQKALQEKMKGASGKDKAKLEKEMKEKQKELELQNAYLQEKLQKQTEEINMRIKAVQRSRVDEAALLKEVTNFVALCNEANAISQEMRKNITFELKLVTIIPDSGALDSDRFMNSLELQIIVRNKKGLSWRWSKEKFSTRIYMMRDCYQEWAEDHSIVTPEEVDPFYDPPEDQLIGKCHFYMESLAFLLDNTQSVPIVDQAGRKQGEVLISVIPVSLDGKEVEPTEEPTSMLGKMLEFVVAITRAEGLPKGLCTSPFARFNILGDTQTHQTPVIAGRTDKPRWDYERSFKIKVDTDFLSFLESGALAVEVWAQQVLSGAVSSSGKQVRQARVLFIYLKEGKNLVAKDAGNKSDPFVLFRVGEISYRSKIIPKTLNPKWEQEIPIILPQTANSVLLEVWDDDGKGKSEYMGEANIPLSRLNPGIAVKQEVTLHNVAKGKVVLSLLLTKWSMD